MKNPPKRDMTLDEWAFIVGYWVGLAMGLLIGAVVVLVIVL